MTLREITHAIGVGEYNLLLDEVYATMPKTEEPACDIALIDQLQQDWTLFGEYYELVRAVAIQVNGDEYRSTWVKVTAAYAMAHKVAMARKVPAPTPDGTVVTAMLPLYTLLPMIPMGIEEYRRRGFSAEEIQDLTKSYRGGLQIVKQQTGMPGINKTYYNWLMLFAKAAIFQTDGLQFELRTLPDDVVYLKKKATGEVVPLMNTLPIHRSGLNLVGSAGFEDETGAIEPNFHEDDQNFYGHSCTDCKIDLEEKAFPKSQWEAFLCPGEECLSIHIPSGTDISIAALNRYFETGRAIAKERYPEHKSTAIYGSSWILDPALIQFVGEGSKIAGLQSRFIKYPQLSGSRPSFSFVFGKPNYDNYEDLPENTSLQRKLKKLYLEGGCTRTYAGIVVE